MLNPPAIVDFIAQNYRYKSVDPHISHDVGLTEILYQLIPYLMEPGGSICIHKGSPIIPIPSRINPIPRIAIYFFKILSNNGELL